VTVVRSDTPAEWLFVRADGGLIEPLNAVDPNVRRQQTREILALNGAVYVSSVSGIERTGSFLSGRVTCHEMPPERSLDIDTPWDWHLIECLVAAPCFRA
jgi:CMP-N-acetylneuraminic acid synthetase